MGARPMARLIQDTIRSALADELLFGKLASGGKVTVDRQGRQDPARFRGRKGRSHRLTIASNPESRATLHGFFISRIPA
jgi:hypothetical protein